MTQSSIGQRSDGVINYGDVSGALTVDLAYSAIAFNATGNVTLTFINEPSYGVNRPIAFYITRTTASGAQITWPVNVTFNTAFEPQPVDGQTMVASVSTINGGSSYIGFANASVYEVTASGLATTVNPSDANSNLILTNGNKTFTTAPYPVTWRYDTARGFGGKNSGKWRLAFRIDTPPSGGSSGKGSYLMMGVADGSAPLSSILGGNAISAAILMYSTSNGSSFNKVNANTLTTLTSPPAYPTVGGNILGILFDASLGKFWATWDGAMLGGGDPEAGTGSLYDMNDGTTYFPAVCCAGQDNTTGAPTVGVATMLNEVQDPYASNWPSFQNWTA